MAINFGPVVWSSEDHHVMLNPRWPAEDLAKLQGAGEELLIKHGSEPSVVIASSGTSAGSWREIKLILLSKKAILAAAESVSMACQMNNADRFAQSLPEFHVGGLGTRARAYLSGAAVVPMKQTAWDPRKFHKEASAEKITVVSLVPTQLFDLLQMGLKPWPQLRIVIIGGAELSKKLEAQARAHEWLLLVTYGMTETSAMFAVRSEADPSLGFKVLPHIQASAGVNGHLQVRGSSLAKGYARKTDQGLAWQNLTNNEGWFVTEDRGEIRNGRLFVFGRDRDQVKINGENVNLAVLRQVLESEALATKQNSSGFHLTAVPDARAGHKLVLFATAGIDAPILLESYHRRILPFERIQHTEIVAEIPRTDLGKVRDQILQDLLKGTKP